MASTILDFPGIPIECPRVSPIYIKDRLGNLFWSPFWLEYDCFLACFSLLCCDVNLRTQWYVWRPSKSLGIIFLRQDLAENHEPDWLECREICLFEDCRSGIVLFHFHAYAGSLSELRVRRLKTKSLGHIAFSKSHSTAIFLSCLAFQVEGCWGTDGDASGAQPLVGPCISHGICQGGCG